MRAITVAFQHKGSVQWNEDRDKYARLIPNLHPCKERHVMV